MKKIVLTGLFLASSALFAQSATTLTTFGTRNDQGSDVYGSRLYEQSVTISTQNYEVDTFWERFFNPANTQKNFSNVVTNATARLSVEASSACSIAGPGVLPEAGCSGQKPFLINDEAVAGVMDGDTIHLVFQPAYDDTAKVQTYGDTNATLLYPLDVLRSGYYKNEPDETGKASFFTFFTAIFEAFFDNMIDFFSFFTTGTIADNKASSSTLDAEDRRQRYIANIVSGVEQSHRMQKEDSLNKGILNSPLSLLHYSESQTQQATCQLFFFSASSDNLMCRLMNGFGMANWFPFFQNHPGSTVVTDTITIDTENALLALSGKIGGETISTNAPANKTVFSLSSMFDMMMCMMKTMMMGSCSASTPTPDLEEVHHTFSDQDAMTLTIAVTNDGSRVNDFETFKLMGIHSTYGTHSGDEMCTVEQQNYMFMFPFGPPIRETFYKSMGNTVTGMKMTVSTGFFSSTTYDTHNEWISWCSTKNVGQSTSAGSATYTMISHTTNGTGLGRGLMLDLKKTTLRPSDRFNTTQIKLINVSH